MDKQDIIKLAREAGGLPDPMVFIGAYERFAALIAAAEREACAKVCDRYVDSPSDQEAGAALNIQDEIRARSST